MGSKSSNIDTLDGLGHDFVDFYTLGTGLFMIFVRWAKRAATIIKHYILRWPWAPRTSFFPFEGGTVVDGGGERGDKLPSWLETDFLA